MTHPLIFLSQCEALAMTTTVLSILDLTSVTSTSGTEVNLTQINNICFSHRTNAVNKNKLWFQDMFKGITLSLSFLLYIYCIFLRQQQYSYLPPQHSKTLHIFTVHFFLITSYYNILLEATIIVTCLFHQLLFYCNIPLSKKLIVKTFLSLWFE